MEAASTCSEMLVLCFTVLLPPNTGMGGAVLLLVRPLAGAGPSLVVVTVVTACDYVWRAIALRAKGRTFSEAKLAPPRRIDAVTERFETMDKVVIAAINGFAMGGGFMLAERADLRVAVRGAETFLAFVRAYQGVQVLRIGELWALAITLRVVLLGQPQTPAIDAVLETMGRELVLGRIDRAL